MKYSITRYLIFFVTVAFVSVSTGCRLNGPFYHPSAWQFYNPFKGDGGMEYADNAFDELPGEPNSQPPESIAKLNTPSVTTPQGGYGNEFGNRGTAFSTTQSNAAMNVNAQDKNAIGVQEGLFASRQNSSPMTEPGNGAAPGVSPSIASQTPSVIARNSNDQPWNLPTNTSTPNSGFASTTPIPQVASTQPMTSIPNITPTYNIPTNSMPMETISSTAPVTGTTYPAQTQGMGMPPVAPQQPIVQQSAMQQQSQGTPVYNGFAPQPTAPQNSFNPQGQPQNTGFQPMPIPEQTNPNYSSGFTSFAAPNTTDSYRPGSAF